MPTRPPTGPPRDPNNPYRIGQKNERGITICGAKLRRREQKCMRTPMANGRCPIHGGKNPSGVAHPNFKNGRFSEYMPANMLDAYNRGLEDPELLALRSEIALLDARHAQVIARAEKGESADFWADLQRTWGQFMAAVRVGDTKVQNELLPVLNSIITTKAYAERAWEHSERLSLARAKLSTAEQNRLATAQQMISVDRVMIMMAAAVLALKEVVYEHADPTTAKRIIDAAALKHQRLISVGGDRSRDAGPVVDG